MLYVVRISQGTMRQHKTNSPYFQRVTLFGALVKLNGALFQAVSRFLDFTFSQSLIVKLVFLKYDIKCLKIEQSHPISPVY